MSQPTTTVTVDFLQSFSEAFNAHDVGTIMLHMTDDCIFQSSAGPDREGETFVGQSEVSQAFAKVFARFPDAHWGRANHFISGSRAVSEWIFTGTDIDGNKIEVMGCDLFTCREGRIAIKNSFRKNRLPSKEMKPVQR